MLSVAEALGCMAASGPAERSIESVPLARAVSRVLAIPVDARFDLPRADCSAMDGFAFVHADAVAGDPLPVSQRIAAGDRPMALATGSAARIFTGASIPAGADTVVRQEDCVLDGDQLVIDRIPATGSNIRRRGEAILSGARLLMPGHQLGPADLGVMASQGIVEVGVRQRLRIGVLSTGSEIVDPGVSLAPETHHDTNRPLLLALLRGWGFEVVDGGIARDDPENVRSALAGLADQCDAVVVSGGASVGEEDHVCGAMAALGTVEFSKVAIKPGKPVAFGHVGDCPLIAVPGNPGAMWVTTLLLVRPTLLSWQGVSGVATTTCRLSASFSLDEDRRTRCFPARVANHELLLTPSPGSGSVLACADGDGLVVVSPMETVRPGDPVAFLPYKGML